MSKMRDLGPNPEETLVILDELISRKLLDEEKLLLAKLPGYAEYAARVKYHLMPPIW